MGLLAEVTRISRMLLSASQHLSVEIVSLETLASLWQRFLETCSLLVIRADLIVTIRHSRLN
jgi:hypothetical protein